MTNPLPDPARSQRSQGGWSLGAAELACGETLCDVGQRLATAALAEYRTCHSALSSRPGLSSVTSEELAIARAGVVSVPVASERVQSVGCVFARSQDERAGSNDEIRMTNDERDLDPFVIRHSSLLPAPGSPLPAPRHTRIRPPRDVVKLADRLRPLLEPPLETLLSSRSLRFARPPFAFQLDGIAFLVPRHEAVLADEMGLGKTMQAITAIRLLLHQGQLKRVLLVCPKSLVTNWQREFALWAPELPLTVVDGGAARRRWLWREAGDAVTIANYEALVRDRADIHLDTSRFDLVVLDEAQRIKNRNSATNEAVRSITRSRSWALTGTPMENSLDDLAGIFEFVAPGQVDAQMKPRAISRAVADHVLRRTKEQVLTDLPPKLFRDAEVELSPE